MKFIKDIVNYIDWIKVIKAEKALSSSLFNKYHINHTKLYDLYVIVNLEEEDKILPENLKRVKVVENLNHINRYLDEDLGFANSLNVEFNQIEDENGQLTLSYLVVYSLAMNKLSLKWILKNIAIITILLAIFFNFKNEIISWVSSLINQI